MKSYFPDDNYHTPADRHRFFPDRLFPNSRYYFLGRYVWQVIKSRWLVGLGKLDYAGIAYQSYGVFQSAEGCGGRFHIEGMNYLANVKSPVVFAGNHMSSLDANVLPCIILPHLPMTFVVKESLLRYPLFGPVTANWDPISVSRTHPREDLEQVLTQGLVRLQQGISVLIFPEGTRGTSFLPAKFNSLSNKLAQHANVPLIPIALKTDFWQNGQKIKDFGPIHRQKSIHIAFGEPIPPGVKPKLGHQQTIDFIQSHLAQWGVPILEPDKE